MDDYEFFEEDDFIYTIDDHIWEFKSQYMKEYEKEFLYLDKDEDDYLPLDIHNPDHEEEILQRFQMLKHEIQSNLVADKDAYQEWRESFLR
jgi:hypothetical protein